jgi:hypothetical protein
MAIIIPRLLLLLFGSISILGEERLLRSATPLLRNETRLVPDESEHQTIHRIRKKISSTKEKYTRLNVFKDEPLKPSSVCFFICSEEQIKK